jgi:hypothetical protein
MVVYSNRYDFLCHILADDILIEKTFYLCWLEKINGIERNALLLAKLLIHYAVGLFYAMVTDMTFQASNEHVSFFLGPAAE